MQALPAAGAKPDQVNLQIAIPIAPSDLNGHAECVQAQVTGGAMLDQS